MCPFWVKSVFLHLDNLRSEVSDLRDRMSNIERSIEKAIPPPVQTEFQHINKSMSTITSQLDASASSSGHVVSHFQPLSYSASLTGRGSASKLKVIPQPDDRKFNVVVFSIPEQPQGLSRSSRWRKDFDRVSTIITEIEYKASSIRECHCLGKYSATNSRPHPLLVSLNSTADVHDVLFRRQSLSSSISI